MYIPKYLTYYSSISNINISIKTASSPLDCIEGAAGVCRPVSWPTGHLLLAAGKGGRDANERRELGGLCRDTRLQGKEMKKPARVMPGVGIDGDGDGGGGVGGILNLGGSIDFTIWTPPKVKNKPSRTYSTLIECLSSARLVSTHRPPERERERKRETRGTKQNRRRRWRRRRTGGRG